MGDTGTAGELLGWLYTAFKILSLLAIIYLAVVEGRRFRKKALAKKQDDSLAGESEGESEREDSVPKAADAEASQEGAGAKPKE